MGNPADSPPQRVQTAPVVLVHVSNCSSSWKDLPIVMMEQQIMEAINESIIVSASKRMALEHGILSLGKEVRQDQRTGDSCSIKFMTEGILQREVQDSILLHAIFRSIWRNVDGQLSIFRYAISATPEIFTFAHYARKLAYANELSSKEILELPLKRCPEFLLPGIAQINTPYNLLQYEMFSTVFPIIVGDANGCGIIFQLWQSNPKLVLQVLIDMMTTDQGNIVTVKIPRS
ncbi:RNA helicase family protein [Actinidia rufa]|uniref:RNA helicase family protein n=1 Tax=Actinidia rufa TaxID=165716 RepID=A0A7J0DX50_9ERIC|nr:RNA helicase family protein [Actinidia rufa]